MALGPCESAVHGAPHRPGYARRDHEVIDYRMEELPGTGLHFRGPLPRDLGPGRFVACVGAAQTFGCFCEEPYPVLLSARLGLPVLNLGYGGAGPRFFCRPELLAVLGQARAVVIQVMSARSEDNSLFDSGGLEYLRRRSDGAWLAAAEAWRAVLDGDAYIPGVRNRPLRWLARRAGRLRARGLVAETCRNWVASHIALAEALPAPKVLLWFATRSPRQPRSYRNLATLFGDFPQLVDGRMLDGIRGRHERAVECVTSRGLPQPLVSRFTGLPCRVDPALDRPDLGGEVWTHNRYYPSPQMHRDAADVIVPVLQELLDS